MDAPVLKRGQASRQRVLETARDVLASEGLDRFALRDIAKRAGMRLGNLQYYYATRDDLLEAVIRSEFDHNLENLRQLEPRAASLEDYLERVCDCLIAEYTSVGGNIWPVLNLLHLHNRRFRRLSAEIYQQHFEVIVAGIQTFGANGTPAKLLEKARLITAVIDGATLQAHAGPHSQRSSSWRSLCTKASEMVIAIAKT